MTRAAGSVGGGRWTWAQPGCSCRPGLRGCPAVSMVSPSRQCRGPGRVPGSPAISRTPAPGWLPAPRLRWCVELMRTSWRFVTGLIGRVVTENSSQRDLLGGIRRIGIDEISHRKGHRYLTCVIDQDSGRLVWAAPGRNSETLGRFFDELGPARSAQLTHVSADGAEWIHTVVAQRATKAVLCLDPFHVVAWATKALDEVRRATWNTLRRSGDTAAAGQLKGTRWALVKNPEDLTPDQRGSLAGISKVNAGCTGRTCSRNNSAPSSPRKANAAGPPRRLDRLGQTIPAPRIRQARRDHQTVPATDPEHPEPRPLQRQIRSHEHTPQDADPPRLRLPQPRGTHRHGHAHPRWTLPSTSRTGRMRGRPSAAQRPVLGAIKDAARRCAAALRAVPDRPCAPAEMAAVEERQGMSIVINSPTETAGAPVNRRRHDERVVRSWKVESAHLRGDQPCCTTRGRTWTEPSATRRIRLPSRRPIRWPADPRIRSALSPHASPRTDDSFVQY